jgi:hypothetical protein
MTDWKWQRGRWQLSYKSGARWWWLPWALYTGDRATDPWVWRVYLFRLCFGFLKTDWNRPTKLTRQLRRQLERKGRLVMQAGWAPAALLLALLAGCAARSARPAEAPASPASPASPAPQETYCFTPDALLARALVLYKSQPGNSFAPGERDYLSVRMSVGHVPCADLPLLGGDDARAAAAERRRLEDAVRRGVGDALDERARIRELRWWREALWGVSR